MSPYWFTYNAFVLFFDHKKLDHFVHHFFACFYRKKIRWYYSTKSQISFESAVILIMQLNVFVKYLSFRITTPTPCWIWRVFCLICAIYEMQFIWRNVHSIIMRLNKALGYNITPWVNSLKWMVNYKGRSVIFRWR